MQVERILLELMKLENPQTPIAHYAVARRVATSEKIAATVAANYAPCLAYIAELRAEIAELRDRMLVAENMIADTRIAGFERIPMEPQPQLVTISDSETIGRGYFWGTSPTAM